MKKRRLIPVLCAVAVAVGLAGCPGGPGSATDKDADTQTTKVEAGTEKGKDEDNRAKKGGGGVVSKGGKLIIYSPLTESMINSMLAMFGEGTSIGAEYLVMDIGDALKRTQTEADNPQADILWSETIGTIKNKNGHFTNYTTSSGDAFYGEYENTEGSLTRLDTIPSVIMMSTDLIDDIRMGEYEDLLNPELKGKVASADPAASPSSFEYLINMFCTMGDGSPDSGRDYVKQLCAQLDERLLGGSSAVYKGVAGGEYAVGLIFEQGPTQCVGVGVPVKIVYMSEGVISRGNGVYIVKGCPNGPNAQKFVD